MLNSILFAINIKLNIATNNNIISKLAFNGFTTNSIPIALVYEAQAKGLKTLIDVVGPEGLALIKKLETLEKVGNGRATKLIVPSDLTSTAADLTLKGEFLGLDKSMDVDTSELHEEKEEKQDICCEDKGDIKEQIPQKELPDMKFRNEVITNLKSETGLSTEDCFNACEKTGYRFKDALNYLKQTGKLKR